MFPLLVDSLKAPVIQFVPFLHLRHTPTASYIIENVIYPLLPDPREFYALQ